MKLDSQPVYGTIILLSFVGVVFMWMLHPPVGVDANSLAVLNTLTGVLGGMAMQVVQNSFGSSRASAGKDDSIASLSAALAAVQAGPPAPPPVAAAPPEKPPAAAPHPAPPVAPAPQPVPIPPRVASSG
jgi:hypothetical protein